MTARKSRPTRSSHSVRTISQRWYPRGTAPCRVSRFRISRRIGHDCCARSMRSIRAPAYPRKPKPSGTRRPGSRSSRSTSRAACAACAFTRRSPASRRPSGSAPRRKKVLLFIGSDMIWQSDRTPGQAYQDLGCEKRLEDARTTMFAAVDRANLTVHSIDPQGLVNAAPQARAPVRPWTDLRSRSAALDAVWGSTSHPMSGRQNLSVLPDRTGGRVVAGRNSPEEMIPQILDESSAYYLIGIERGPSARPDGMRRLEIKVRSQGCPRRGAAAVCRTGGTARQTAGSAGRDESGTTRERAHRPDAA